MSLDELPGAPVRAHRLREALAAFTVLCAFTVAFLWAPISRYADVHYTAADLTQAMSLTKVEPGHVPGNQLQSDEVTQMHPWLLFNREELAAGRFPLWNPWNGTGRPHFANYQSAVLSPFSVPFYVLDLKSALIASAAAKLLALGLFTYLFLRSIGTGWLGATVGGAAFEFAGHNVLLQYFPHVGATVALPAGIWCAELALRRVEDALTDGAIAHGRGSRLFGPLAGLTVSLLAGLLAGNPEPFYFAALGVGIWIAARLVGLWRKHRRDGRARRELVRAAGKLALACALAAGFSAVQVLPFLEYLRESRVLEQRSMSQTPLETRWWPLHLFPDALGSPASEYKISLTVPPPNYELVNSSYVGATCLILAIACPFLAWRRRGGLFFPLLAVGWHVYAHGELGSTRLIDYIPTLGMAPMNRSQAVWAFAVACAAAIALDALLRRGPRRAWIGAAATLVATGAGIVACLIGADRLIAEYSQVASPYHPKFLSHVPGHLGSQCVWTTMAAVAVAGCLVMRARAVRVSLAALLGVAAFAQTGWLLRDYNPVSEDRFVYPRTPDIEQLQRLVGRERLAILGPDGIPPDSNIVYGLSQLANYDGLWPREVDRLYREHFGETDNWRPIVQGSSRSLILFGTRWVLAKWDWNPLDRGLRWFPKSRNAVPVSVPILPQRPVTQTFLCEHPGLSRVMAVLSTPRNLRPCTLGVRVEDVASGRVVHEEQLTSDQVQATVFTNKHIAWPGEPSLRPPGRPVVIHVPPQADSEGRLYRLTLACEDGVPTSTILAWHMPVLGYGPGASHVGDEPLPGELLFDWTCADDELYEEVARVGEFKLLRLRLAVPRYALWRTLTVFETRQEALDALRERTAEPVQRLVACAEDEATPRWIVDATRAAHARRLVQFDDSGMCYLVAPDGRSLASIHDEPTFRANLFVWDQVERLPASERSRFSVIPDTDVEAKLAAGLRYFEPRKEGAYPVEVLEETPGRIRLKVYRPRRGFLSIRNTWDPGWHARLDGREVPVLKVDHAFQAVQIPGGTWEVELYYLPRSLVLGLWIAAASAAAAVAAWWLSRRGGPEGAVLP